MNIDLYANLIGKSLVFKVISFDIKSAKISLNDIIISLKYDIKLGWLDSKGNQYKVTSKPQSFNPLIL